MGKEIKSPFLLKVSDAIRLRHYSYRTEKSYLFWVRRFIYFNNKQHPETLGEAEVTRFLTHLAIDKHVSPSTQNQAFNAINFMYRHVLERPLNNIQATRAKPKKNLPVVLTNEEVHRLLKQLHGHYWLMACLMYGSGLRLMECVRLRVMQIDFDHLAILVINGKGGKDRVVTLSDSLVTPLKQHLENVKILHEKDLNDGCGSVSLPYALEKSIPMQTVSGAGNMFFLHPEEVSTHIAG